VNKRDERIREAYRDANPCCEICGWWHQVADHAKHGKALRDCERCRDQVDGYWLDCPQVHHILGGPNRYDVACNLLTICGFAHSWIHDHDIIAGRIVCWRIKLSKGEFDAATIAEFSRQHPAGWLEMDKTVDRCRLSERLDLWRREVLEACV
jgi:hypothetical protein